MKIKQQFNQSQKLTEMYTENNDYVTEDIFKLKENICK